MTPSLADRLRAGVATVGGWLGLGAFGVAEVLAGAGFAGLVAQLQHGATPTAEAGACIAAIAGAGCPPLMPLPEVDPAHCGRLLDRGAGGLVGTDGRCSWRSRSRSRRSRPAALEGGERFAASGVDFRLLDAGARARRAARHDAR